MAEKPQKKNKIPFTVTIKDEEGQKREVALYVLRPSVKVQEEARREFNRSMKDALDAKAPLRVKLDTVLRDQQLWDDERQAKFDELAKSLRDDEILLRKGGKISACKEIALRMRKTRQEMRQMRANTAQMDAMTAEGQAEQAKFNYLVAHCTRKDSDDKPYFASVADYLEKSGEEVAFEAANHLATLLYDVDPDFELRLPESAWLKRFGFLNQHNQLLNEKGKAIDEQGRLINEKGRLVNEEGQLIDAYGNPVDEEGELLLPEGEYLPDEPAPEATDRATDRATGEAASPDSPAPQDETEGFSER